MVSKISWGRGGGLVRNGIQRQFICYMLIPNTIQYSTRDGKIGSGISMYYQKIGQCRKTLFIIRKKKNKKK